MEEADFVLLVGTNPRYEAPLLNTRIRKGYVHNETDVALIGPAVDLSYKYEVIVKIHFCIYLFKQYYLFVAQHLGEDPKVIDEIVSGKHPLSKKLSAAKKPVIIVGADQLARKDGAAILSKLHAYANSLNKDVSFGLQFFL